MGSLYVKNIYIYVCMLQRSNPPPGGLGLVVVVVVGVVVGLVVVVVVVVIVVLVVHDTSNLRQSRGAEVSKVICL